MIGIVVVSHSHALAKAAVDLALEMVPANRPAVEVAAGLDETTFGTDAAAVSAAIEAADSGDGVLVLLDLGSAVMSSEIATEFLDPELAERVRVSPAPLIEGLVAAVVSASGGASLLDVAAEAEQGLAGKTSQLESVGTRTPASSTGEEAGEEQTDSLTVPNKHGLHARPAAAFVAVVNQHDAVLQVRNLTRSTGPVDGRSVTALSTLGARQGDQLELHATGPDTGALFVSLHQFETTNFGDGDGDAPAEPEAGATAATVTGRLTRFEIDPDPDGSLAHGHGEADLAQFRAALDQARSELADLVRRARTEVSAAAADMVGVQLMLLDDATVTAPVQEAISSGQATIPAWQAHLAKLQQTFAALADPYLQARGQDLASLERRVRAALLSVPAPVPPPAEILLLDELDAPTAALLPGTVRGVITAGGGSLGHGALVAKGRGITLAADRASDFAHAHEGEQVTLTV